MNFDPGFPIAVKTNPMGFAYGEGVSGSVPELRTLDRIRKSLMAPICTGPEIVYCIAMDVALETDNPDLEQRNLLYGVVTYAAGDAGNCYAVYGSAGDVIIVPPG